MSVKMNEVWGLTDTLRNSKNQFEPKSLVDTLNGKINKSLEPPSSVLKVLLHKEASVEEQRN